MKSKTAYSTNEKFGISLYSKVTGKNSFLNAIKLTPSNDQKKSDDSNHKYKVEVASIGSRYL